MLRWIFVLIFPVTLSAQLKRFEFSEYKMGSSFNLIFYHTDSLEANAFAKECYSLVDSLNNIFSNYSETSEAGRLASSTSLKEIKVSDELFRMIVLSKHIWKRSSKSFDVTTGSITQLWQQARTEKRFPADSEIKQAKEFSGFKNVSFDVFLKTISFKKQGIIMDFGGIVPGYAAQRVIELLKTRNVNIALADASGDIVVSDPPPGKEGWSVAINLPESENEVWDQNLELKNQAVSTSGDIYRYIVHNGKKYSHIINPRTGYGVTSQRNVTVIAKDGTTADWLATAGSILPIKKALRLAKKEHAAIMIARLKGEKIITKSSKKFQKYFQHKEP